MGDVIQSQDVAQQTDTRPNEFLARKTLASHSICPRTSAQNIDSKTTEVDTTSSGKVVAITTAGILEHDSFVLRGDYWEIRYRGMTGLIDNNRGMHYIALLIQHSLTVQGPLHATELVALATGKQQPVELNIKDPILDSEAEQQLTKRLEELAFQRNSAAGCGDYESVAQLDEEADRITDELVSVHTPHVAGNRRGTFSDAGEKARKAVSKAIKETISKLSSLPGLQSLAEHLSKTIRKGQWLSYTGDLTWEIVLQPAHSEKKSSLRRAK